mgnify:CR=1|jgi:hypothetical protein|tara:strand:+ start:156 stop:383 length:228 start_codon:yes stop_codon:yes gene_type:complete
MAKRNPQCTTFIRNFNAKRVVSGWNQIDMQPNNVIQPRCFAVGQQANMQQAHDKAVRKQQLAANLAELDRLLESL